MVMWLFRNKYFRRREFDILLFDMFLFGGSYYFCLLRNYWEGLFFVVVKEFFCDFKSFRMIFLENSFGSEFFSRGFL